MARYCTNCGRELREGEVCTCQKQDESSPNRSASEDSRQGKEGISEEIYASSEERLIDEDPQDEEKTVSYPQGRYPDASQDEDYTVRDSRQTEYRQGGTQGGYQQGDSRQTEYRQEGAQGGYQQGNFRQAEYRQGHAQGGYQQGDSRQTGYRQGGAQGGYQQRNYRQGDFQNNGYQQGNYQQRDPRGGYQQGNYQQRNYQGGYQQGNYQQRDAQGNYQQRNYQQGGYQKNEHQEFYGMNGQWFSERKDNLVKHTKNIFAQIPKLICRPDSTMEAISRQNSSILGIEMISFQAVVMLVILLVGNAYLNSLTHGYLSFNPLMIVVFAAVMIFAMAYLEAGILTGITLAFKGKTSIHKMLCAVGYKALIQGIILLITALLFFVSWKVAIILYMIGSMAAQLFFIDGYRNAVEIHKDRRLYAFWLGEVLFFIAMVIILNFILTSMVTSVIGNYLNNYGGIVNGLMRELY